MHGNSRLTPRGRLTLVLRVESGRPVAHVATEMGISRPTAYKWWRRWRSEGSEGLIDRSSRPKSCPHQTSIEVELEIAELRRELKLGPARIGSRLGVAPSTVHKVLVRLGLNRLSWIDRPTGQVIRRYERDAPGDLIHVDIKKLGLIPDGGGWKSRGRASTRLYRTGHTRTGYACIHSAVDDHSRLAYSEILSNEQKETAAAFWLRANAFFERHGITVTEVLTDNGGCYRSYSFHDALGEARHRFTRPYRPQTNGKVERFNRALLEEWAYVRPTFQRPSAPRHLPTGFISTTIIEATPRSRADLPSAVSTTWLVNTTRRDPTAARRSGEIARQPARRDVGFGKS